MLDREHDRIKLQADVDAFIARGGKIEYLPPGACSEKNGLAYEYFDYSAVEKPDLWRSRERY
jgi:hypothetical protein